MKTWSEDEADGFADRRDAARSIHQILSNWVTVDGEPLIFDNIFYLTSIQGSCSTLLYPISLLSGC